MIDNHLQTNLIYPLKINRQKIDTLSSDEQRIIKHAKNIIRNRGVEHFYVANLLAKNGGFQVKDAEIILNLLNKEIFIPIEI